VSLPDDSSLDGLEVKRFRSSLRVFPGVHSYHRLLPVTVAVSALFALLFVRLYDFAAYRSPRRPADLFLSLI
jgi:hypothetical protein